MLYNLTHFMTENGYAIVHQILLVRLCRNKDFFTLSLYRVHESAEKFLWFHVRKAPHSDCGNTTPDQLS